jgi:hypothetical protein
MYINIHRYIYIEEIEISMNILQLPSNNIIILNFFKYANFDYIFIWVLGSKSANTNALDIHNVKRVAGRIVFAAKDLCQNNREEADTQITKLRSQIIETNLQISDLKKIALKSKAESTHLLPVKEDVSIIGM